MELPKRAKGDEFTRPGEYPELRRRLREKSAGMRIPTVVAYAFDDRTRLLPYHFASMRMAPAGARGVAAALHDSGLTRTRIVLQQWTANFDPRLARLDGEPIEMFLVSSMQIHAERAYRLVADACAIPKPDRPLIIAGGPKAIYEPWDFFDIEGDPELSADVAVTGEEFVLAQLLDVLLDYRGENGHMRQAFLAARRDGALEAVPGLVYCQDDTPDAALISTGIQRLVEDLDEFPHPIIGFRLLEPPHRCAELRSRPLPESEVKRRSLVASLSLSHGCKFNCDYCPIPAYNQRTYRHKSGERIVDEIRQIRERLGIRFFFGTDDNFFNHRASVASMFETMSRAQVAGKPLGDVVCWGTEATEFDTWKNRDLLPMARRAGLRALWFGIEDITATLVRKGQSIGKTAELFALLNRHEIAPMPMMMHHDGQPLVSPKGLYGLLNQVRYLRDCGAQSMQVTVLTPAVGTRSYEGNYDRRLVFERIGGGRILQCHFDGNHVVASSSKSPWRMQLNILAAYATYYNPITTLRSLAMPVNRRMAKEILFRHAIGMAGLIRTAVHSTTWAARLWRGPVVRSSRVPGPRRQLIDLSSSPQQAERLTA